MAVSELHILKIPFEYFHAEDLVLSPVMSKETFKQQITKHFRNVDEN